MNPPTLEISAAASGDILEQADWFASRRDQRLGERWAEAVTETVLSLLAFPESGASGGLAPELPPDIRRVPVRGFPRHWVFYRLVGGKLQILRVLHGGRSLSGLLG